MSNAKVSLAALAREALDQQSTGATHAQMAIEGEALTREERAALEQRANIDSGTKQALEWLSEAKEAIFTDAFSRAAYLRIKIGKLAQEESPDPDAVLTTLFSACASKMYVRGEKRGEMTQIPAIPLFRYMDRGEAMKHVRRPIGRIAASKNTAFNPPRLETHGIKWLVPATTTDREAYFAMQKLLDSMPKILADYFAQSSKLDVREATWLAIQFMPFARVCGTGAIDRQFEVTDAGLRHKDSKKEFVKFELSTHEIVLFGTSAHSAKVVEALAQFV